MKNIIFDKSLYLAVSLQGIKKEDTIKVIRNFIIQIYGLEEGENREIIIEAKRYI